MKRLIACLLATLPYIGAVAHVWDELAILARRNGDGTFTLEKDSYLAVSTYTNAVFFDYNNDGNLDLLIMGQGTGIWEKRMGIVLRKLLLRVFCHTRMKDSSILYP